MTSFECFSTHVDAVDSDGDVFDGDGIHVASELHLQHPLEAPAHEGHVGDPGGHCDRERERENEAKQGYNKINVLGFLC